MNDKKRSSTKKKYRTTINKTLRESNSCSDCQLLVSLREKKMNLGTLHNVIRLP